MFRVLRRWRNVENYFNDVNQLANANSIAVSANSP